MQSETGKSRRVHKVVLWTSVVVVVGAIGVALEAIRAATLKPSISTDYAKQINDLARSQIPVGANVAEWRDLFELARQLSPLGPEQDTDDPAAITDALTPEAFAQLESLPQFAYAIKRFDAHSSITAQSAPLLDEGLNLGPIRGAARLVRARLQTAFARNQLDIVRMSMDQLDALTTASYLQPSGRAFQSGLALDSLIDGTVRNALIHQQITPAMAAELLAAYAKFRPRPTFQYVMEVDRLCMRDAIQRVFTDDGKGSGSLIDSAFAAEMIAVYQLPPSVLQTLDPRAQERLQAATHWRQNMFRWNRPTRAQVYVAADQVWEEIQNDNALPRAQRRDFEQWKAWRAAQLTPELQLLVDATGLEMVPSTIDGTVAKRNGTIIQLALIAYKHRVGTYPDALAELVPTDLPVLPRDPLSPDGQFIYRREGEAYSLLSVGVDGMPNNGAMRPDNQFRVFHDTIDGKGFDFDFSSSVAF